MRIGVVFPQIEIEPDAGAIRAYAEAAQDLGYTHLLAYDHVLGADVGHRPNWSGPYTTADAFHEPFVLFGYLAGVAPELELVSGVIVLPQRQTALVAKQAAQVDLFTNGRSRLGIGVGWNQVEFVALNEEFRTRGRRVEEQIAVLRALWTEPSVTFQGTYHQIDAAGINPLPVQRPIPVWIGGSSRIAIERAGRVADGWMPQRRPNDELATDIALLHAAATAAGRSPDAIGIEGRLSLKDMSDAEWVDELTRWRALGVTHLSINTMGLGLTTADAHIAALRRFADASQESGVRSQKNDGFLDASE